MRIGIVTYHQVINDGAVLQAYAQQQAVQKLFPSEKVEIVDFRYRVVENRERFNILKDVIKFRKSAISKLMKHRRIRKFINSRLRLSKKRIISNDLVSVANYINQNYDAVIVGSDEVWKIDYKKFSRPFPNLYWLPKPINVLRIASAATANTLNLASLKTEDTEKVKMLFSEFQLIGVRDQFTLDFVKSNTIDKQVELVPDPTFALEFEERIFEKAKKKLVDAGVDMEKPIICLSLSSNIKELNQFSGRLFSEFSTLGYQIVSIGQYNEFSHFNLTAQLDPLEWAHIYRFFKFCVTDRFHSTIFSIRNNINFVSIDFSERYTSNEKGKIHDLLARINLLDHYMNLKEVSMQDAVRLTLRTNEEYSNDNFSHRLKEIDGQLGTGYLNFIRKIALLQR